LISGGGRPPPYRSSKAKLSGLEYFYVEQENLPVPGDANIKKSIGYLKKNILAGLK